MADETAPEPAEGRAQAPATEPAHELAHEPGNRRYTLRVGGQLTAVVDYAINGDAISFTRTFTQPGHRGKGFAAEVVKFAVDDVEAAGDYSIVPMCWYVAQWFDKHPERSGLLSR